MDRVYIPARARHWGWLWKCENERNLRPKELRTVVSKCIRNGSDDSRVNVNDYIKHTRLCRRFFKFNLHISILFVSALPHTENSEYSIRLSPRRTAPSPPSFLASCKFEFMLRFSGPSTISSVEPFRTSNKTVPWLVYSRHEMNTPWRLPWRLHRASLWTLWSVVFSITIWWGIELYSCAIMRAKSSDNPRLELPEVSSRRVLKNRFPNSDFAHRQKVSI